MHTALRPFSTAAITLVGAGAIAIAPVAPPLPDVQARTISSIEVQLAASSFVDPITRWSQVLSTTYTNVNNIADQFGRNQMPLLNQVLANQSGYLQDVVNGLQGTGEGLTTWVNGSFRPALQTALQQLMAGELAAATQTITSSLANIVYAAFSMAPAIAIPGKILANFTATVQRAMSLQTLSTVFTGFTGSMYNAVNALGASAQAVLDSIKAGDLLGAVGAIANAPANAIDAMLNGPGALLSFRRSPSGAIYSGGMVTYLLLKLPEQIAAAIRPPSTAIASTMVADTDIATPPSVDAQMVSLDAGSTPEEGAAGHAPADENPAEVTEPPADSETGTITDEVTVEAAPPATEVVDEADENGSTDDAIGSEESEDPTGTEESEDSDISEAPDDATDLSGGDAEESDNTRPGSTTGNGSGLNAGADDDDSDNPTAGNTRTGSGNDSSGNDAGGSNGDSDSGSDS